MFEFISFLPEFFLFFMVFVVLLFCIIYYLSSVLNYPNFSLNTVYLSSVVLIYTFFLFLNSHVYYLDFSIIYKNQSNLLLSEFFIFICIFIFLISFFYNKFLNIHSFEYLIFIFLSLGSFLVFINVTNFILIYIILELQSILISILISLKKNNRYSIEASIKYFILGSFSSLILLFGISVIYGSTGLLSIHEMNLFLNYFENINNQLVLFSIHMSSVFILIGLLFKIYSAPFHFWLPDIYEGSPTSVLIYISTIQIIAMVFFFLKIYYYLLFDFLKLKEFIISIISILTLVFGCIGALSQNRIKKLISLSAVTMNGFFLFSIIYNNFILVETSLMYLFIYTFTILLLFSLLLNLFIGDLNVTSFSDFYNIYSNNKIIANLFTILLFSISGIPPFIGFISKLFWLKSLVSEYNIYIFILLLIFLIVSFYYIRLLKSVHTFFQNNFYKFNILKSFSYDSSIIIIFNQLLLMFFIFNTGIIRNFLKIVLYNFLSLI